MSHGQQGPRVEARQLKDAVEENLTRPCQPEKAGAHDFNEHLLSFPKGGPDDLLDGPPLNLRDVTW